MAAVAAAEFTPAAQVAEQAVQVAAEAVHQEAVKEHPAELTKALAVAADQHQEH